MQLEIDSEVIKKYLDATNKNSMDRAYASDIIHSFLSFVVDEEKEKKLEHEEPIIFKLTQAERIDAYKELWFSSLEFDSAETTIEKGFNKEAGKTKIEVYDLMERLRDYMDVNSRELLQQELRREIELRKQQKE